MSDKTEYELLFVIDGVDIDDDEISTLTERFDAVLSWNRGLHRLAISADGVSAVEAFRSLLDQLASAVPGLRLLRLDPDLVGVSDISERTGHSRQNVQQWVSGERYGHRRFPPPEGCVGRSLVWRWVDVNEWLRPLGADDHQIRPNRYEMTHIDMILAERNHLAESHFTMEWPRVARGARGSTSGGRLIHSPEMHKNLISRIPRVTGSDLREWFHRLESGPSFLRSAECATWLAHEHGLTSAYAAAIVHEYELQRRLAQRSSGTGSDGTAGASQQPGTIRK